MKAKTFEKLLRKIVREEIDYSLRREIKSLKEDLRDELKPSIIERHVNSSLKESQPSLRNEIMGSDNTPKKPFVKQNFTSNSSLNDLLNETAQGDTNLDRGSSPVSMNEDFSTIGGMPVEAAPKVVQEAVNRDYSDLMKAINDKKKHKP